MSLDLVSDGILDLISPEVCSVNKDSVLCNTKEYLRYIIKLANDSFNSCAIHFTALSLRLLLELITLAVYIDIHHVYRYRSLSEKLSLIKSFSLGSALGRSTMFRRTFVKVFGPRDGRTLIDNVKSLYRVLSRYMHGPPVSCLHTASLFNPCTCVEELNELRDTVGRVIDVVKKVVYTWALVAKDLR